MYNLYTKLLKFIEIDHKFSNGLVDERGNIRRQTTISKFFDL